VGTRHFRASVVAVIERGDGTILAFERGDAPGNWQLPQGGIEQGEEALDAVWREVKEETGLGPADLALVGEHPHWVAYEWPPAVRAGRRGIGQVQRWFTFRALDDDVVPRPDGTEFTGWRWVERDWLIDHIVPFRTAAYRQVLEG
jgi:putative (di)nucleoside polyphosphate hydrolase